MLNVSEALAVPAMLVNAAPVPLNHCTYNTCAAPPLVIGAAVVTLMAVKAVPGTTGVASSLFNNRIKALEAPPMVVVITPEALMLVLLESTVTDMVLTEFPQVLTLMLKAVSPVEEPDAWICCQKMVGKLIVAEVVFPVAGGVVPEATFTTQVEDLTTPVMVTVPSEAKACPPDIKPNTAAHAPSADRKLIRGAAAWFMKTPVENLVVLHGDGDVIGHAPSPGLTTRCVVLDIKRDRSISLV